MTHLNRTILHLITLAIFSFTLIETNCQLTKKAPDHLYVIPSSMSTPYSVHAEDMVEWWDYTSLLKGDLRELVKLFKQGTPIARDQFKSYDIRIRIDLEENKDQILLNKYGQTLTKEGCWLLSPKTVKEIELIIRNLQAFN